MAEPIAIVAAAGRFPGAGADLDLFWSNVVNAVDCSREVPAGRWRLPPETCVVPGGPTPDAVPHARGYYLDPFEPDLTGLAIDPSFVAALDPLFHLVLDVGGRAWRVAKSEGVDRRKVGVILGNICLPTDAANDLCREVLGGRLAEAMGRPREARRTHALNRHVAGLPAGLLAKALGLGLGAFTLDAACASSLYALALAADELRAGRADAMLAGGCSRPDALYTQMGFAQLRALSPTGRCSPFDAAADGLMVGEGAGVFVLKRLDDALAAKDDILALFSGQGLSNDTAGNLLAPAQEGQSRAIRTAYESAKWSPTDVDLIECHATGTPVGDAVEFESLRGAWGTSGWKPGQCVIGSVKSTVGHLLTGAGAAAVMKVIKAMAAKSRPPQANFSTPGSALTYAGGPFRVPTKSEPWPDRADGRPRRAAVSGFGFGGVNAHLLFEEWGHRGFVAHTSQALTPVPKLAGKNTTDAPIAVVGLAAHFGPWDSLRDVQERILGGGVDHPATPKRTGWDHADGPRTPAYSVEDLVVPLDRFRVPPKEIEEMLPQQAVALCVAAAALDDVRRTDGQDPKVTPARQADPRTGVYLGVNLDPNTTNFHLRWATKRIAADLADAAAPPLTADRTLGALASCAASRIAKAFQFGGPAFTVSSEEASAGRALELAVRALRRNDLDRVVVGGIDFAGDPRAVAAADELAPLSRSGLTSPFATDSPGAVPGEGAAAVVLKRLADAERDGDRVYAVIRGIGSAVGGPAAGTGPDAATHASSLLRALSDAAVGPGDVDYYEAAATGSPIHDAPEAEALAALFAAADRPYPLAVSAVAGQIGHTGAASFLAGFVKACLAVYHEILPPAPAPAERMRPELAASGKLDATMAPRFWLTDQPGARRAVVAGRGVDGSAVHAVIEESAKNRPQPVEVRSRPTVERRQPLGPRAEAVFAVEYETYAEWEAKAAELDALAGTHVSAERLARVWLARYRPDPKKRRAVSLVARTPDDLRDLLRATRETLAENPDAAIPDGNALAPRAALRDRIFHSPKPLGRLGKLAFVFPGSGNHYAGMGRSLAASWPELLRRQQAENEQLRGQYAPDRFWTATIPPGTTAKEFLFGQVALGTLTSDLLQSLGVKPDAMIGVSLGESSGLFGVRIWRSRDEMLRRVRTSTLFGPDLGPPYRAAQQQLNLPADPPPEWVVGVVGASPESIRTKLRPELRAYLLIINTPAECVIGGLRDDVLELASLVGGPFVPLSGITIAHCEAGKPVEKPYRDLHRLPVAPATNVKVYSGAWGRKYTPTEANAADSITTGLVGPIDVPKLIETAYRDGIKIFLEVGPGASATRSISMILGSRPHVARAMTSARQDETALVLRAVAHLIAERASVDWGGLYGRESAVAAHQDLGPDSRPTTTIPVGLVAAPIPVLMPSGDPESQLMRSKLRPTDSINLDQFPNPPAEWHAHDSAVGVAAAAAADFPPDDEDAVLRTSPKGRTPSPLFAQAIPTPIETTPLPVSPEPVTPSLATPAMPTPPPVVIERRRAVPMPDVAPVLAAAVATQAATASAHELFLRTQAEATETAAAALAVHAALVRRLMGELDEPVIAGVYEPDVSEEDLAILNRLDAKRVVFQTSPTEVPRSLDTAQCFEFARGRIGDVLGPVFAEIDSHPTRVRLPDRELMLVDRIVTIEGEPKSLTKGRVVTEHTVTPDRWYLDSGVCPTSVTVESGQADLFLSGFLGIDFITKGLAVYRLLDAVVTFHRGLPKVGEKIVYDIHIDEFFNQADAWLFRFHFEGTIDGRPMLSMTNGVAGFFTQAALDAGKGIVHTRLDRMPRPGKRPDDWEDLVPQATCSLDATGVLALRDGNVSSAFGPDFDGLALRQPMKLPGGKLRLVDRVPEIDPEGGRFGLGYVRAEYDIDPADWFLTCHFVDDRVMPGTLMYECCLHTLRILLMRMGWVGEDGEVVCEPVPGVNSRLKCRGQVLDTTKLVTYEVSIKELGYGPEPYAIADALMSADGKPIVEITDMSLRMSGLTHEKLKEAWASEEKSRTHVRAEKPAIYDTASILAYSNGKPSEAFGEPYRIFDHERVIARLPGPPYQFLDRVTAVTGEPFVLKAGAACETEYLVPADEWFFPENRCGRMPFSILLEIALQPCGWLAAYCGSALTSPNDLSFRNLGGKGTQFRAVGPDAGVLTVNVKLTNVSNSAGMIIQHFDLLVTDSVGKVYEGTTYFGFFAKAALANQIGMPQAKVPVPTPAEAARAFTDSLPHDPPFPGPMLRMVDAIEAFIPDGGKAGLGKIVGTIKVDPSFWFFKAHFYQDPVWPGSLGLESFLQLLKYVSWKRYGAAPASGWQAMALNRPHEWTYRGQVIPKDREVTVVLEVTKADDAKRILTADGFLIVDGRIIYQMKDFTLE